jgi:glyoxylase-like metal-dependent hydrolase (beta-lactamase superfamily II)
MPTPRHVILLIAGLLALTAAGAALSSSRTSSPPSHGNIVQIPLTWSNAFLVLGRRPVLVDPGSPSDGDFERLRNALAAHGYGFADLGLIILTHGHADHAGGTARVAAASGAPVLAGAPDAAMLRRGHHGELRAMGVEARLVRPFIRPDFPSVNAAVLLTDSAGGGSLDLRAYGIDATARLTPGHTPGSLVVLVEDGSAGRAAIVGDLARGGMMNGRLRAHVPHRHYFHENAERAEAAAVALLRDGVGRFYVGHGGPIAAAALRSRFAHEPEAVREQ